MLNITDTVSIDKSLKVSHFITGNYEWNVAKLQSLVGTSQLQLILAIPVPFNPIPNSVCWGLSGNDEFSTKLATWPAYGLNSGNLVVWEYNWIWKLDLMPKLKIFLRQLCHAWLPIKATLSKRGVDIDPLSHFRHSEIEGQNHLFLHCPISQECWTLAVAHNWIDSSFVSRQQYSILQSLCARNTTSTAKIERVVALFWSIWKTRNNMVFHNGTPILEITLIRAKKASVEWHMRHKLT